MKKRRDIGMEEDGMVIKHVQWEETAGERSKRIRECGKVQSTGLTLE